MALFMYGDALSFGIKLLVDRYKRIYNGKEWNWMNIKDTHGDLHI